MHTSKLFLVWILICLVGVSLIPRAGQTQADDTPPDLPDEATSLQVHLPYILEGRPPRGELIEGGSALPIEYLGEKIPVQGAKRFFTDQILDTTGDLSIWIPPNANPVRGIFFEHSTFYNRPNPNDPDWRNQVAQNRALASRQLASKWGFAYIAGTSWASDRRSFSAQEEHFNNAIDHFIRVTGRSELRHAPLVVMGESRTAGFGAYLSKKYPERMIAYVVKVMGGQGAIPNVPGLIVMGERDNLQTNMNAVRRDRAEGALITPAITWRVGHICDRCGDLIWPFMDQMVLERVPADADPRNGPVTLKPISERDGWLGDMEQWNAIYPYDQYPGDKSKAAWFPNRYIAELWLNYMLKEPAATLTWPTQPYSWSKGFTQEPAPLFGGKPRELKANTPIDLVATLRQPVSGEIRFFSGDVDLGAGTVSADGKQVTLRGLTLPPGLYGIILKQGERPLAWPGGLILLK